MPVKADDVRPGKCYSATIQKKKAIVRVIEVAGADVKITENAGKPGQATTVHKARRVKWEYQFAIPPNGRWRPGTRILPMRDFLMGIEEEVSCS
jgi:hypothetical protein